MSRTVNTKPLDDALDYAEEKIFALANRVGKIVVKEIKSVLKEKKIIATKLLYKNVKYRVVGSIAKEIVLIAGINDKKVVSSTGYPYAGVLQYGRKGGRVPYSTIQKWIELKIKKGSLKLSDKQTVEQATYLITQHIKRKGIKATKFFDVAILKALPKIKAEIISAGMKYT